MRILVTGRQGQLAQALAEQAVPGLAITTLGRPELDITDPASIAQSIQTVRPDVVVNAAAYTAVDRAESDAAAAFAVNRDGAAAVAAATAAAGVKLIHISTDYVFPGDKPAPYVETDTTGPLGVYGQSKLEGEALVARTHPGAAILRTAWVYSPFGANFVKTMLRLAASRPQLRVVDDQHGNPTSALALARLIIALAGRLDNRGGLYHAAAQGACTWCGFAREIFALARHEGIVSAEVEAITTADYPTPARRPHNSRLDSSLLLERYGLQLPGWRASLAETVARLAQQGPVT